MASKKLSNIEQQRMQQQLSLQPPVQRIDQKKLLEQHIQQDVQEHIWLHLEQQQCQRAAAHFRQQQQIQQQQQQTWIKQHMMVREQQKKQHCLVILVVLFSHKLNKLIRYAISLKCLLFYYNNTMRKLHIKCDKI